jgi:hypothetical protein
MCLVLTGVLRQERYLYMGEAKDRRRRRGIGRHPAQRVGDGFTPRSVLVWNLACKLFQTMMLHAMNFWKIS